MSLNTYDSSSGTLTNIASSSRVWTGTKDEWNALVQAGTAPRNVLVAITDDEIELDSTPTDGSSAAVTSDGIYNNCLVSKGDGARSSADDLNSLVTQGTFSVRSVNQTVPLHSPSGYSNVYGILNVYNNRGNDKTIQDYVSQQLHLFSDNSFWIRNRVGNTWSAWKKVTS